MKRRYYLRGLAVGILITTLILGIAGRDKRPLTDAEIKARAQELGMVDGSGIKLADIQPPESAEPEVQPTESAEPEIQLAESVEPESQPTESVEPEVQPTESAEPEVQPTESTEPEVQPTESAEPESQPTESTEPESQPTESAEPEVQPTESAEPEVQPTESAEPEVQPTESAEPEVQPVTIQIKSGASSYTVSKDLAAAGLVASANDFDDYLCRNGYAGRIHVGTYQILPGTGEKEIAEMIAK